MENRNPGLTNGEKQKFSGHFCPQLCTSLVRNKLKPFTGVGGGGGKFILIELECKSISGKSSQPVRCRLPTFAFWCENSSEQWKCQTYQIKHKWRSLTMPKTDGQLCVVGLFVAEIGTYQRTGNAPNFPGRRMQMSEGRRVRGSISVSHLNCDCDEFAVR